MRCLTHTLALLVLTASLVWAWELPCEAMDAAETIPASTAPEQSPDAKLLVHGCQHCGHLTAHLLGQPANYGPATIPALALSFEPPRVPPLHSLTDTLLRPPATRLS